MQWLGSFPSPLPSLPLFPPWKYQSEGLSNGNKPCGRNVLKRRKTYTLENYPLIVLLRGKAVKKKSLSIKYTESNSRESIEIIEIGLFLHQQTTSVIKAFIWLNGIQGRGIKCAQFNWRKAVSLCSGWDHVAWWQRVDNMEIKMIKQRSVIYRLIFCERKAVPFWKRWL